jgi:hypothetical protein
MNVYCQKCGQPNHYGSKKPIFCGQCGDPLDGRPKKSIGSKRENAKKRTSRVKLEESENDEEQEITSIPDVQGLAVEIEAPKLKGFTIGDIAGSSPESASIDDIEVAPGDAPPLDEKKFLSDFQKEAGSLRQKGKGNA